ncbi:MAG: reverse transcriptase domain-containing protein [Rhodoblastus sp.]
MTEGLLQKLSADLAIAMSDLVRIVATAPRRYKVYEIPKRTGGTRIIAQPARDLKILQRYLHDTLLKKLPVHSDAMGYVEGRSIAHNARRHVDSAVILKLDFKDFFPSIMVADWERVAKKAALELSPADLRVCSRNLVLGREFQRSKVPVDWCSVVAKAVKHRDVRA